MKIRSLHRDEAGRPCDHTGALRRAARVISTHALWVSWMWCILMTLSGGRIQLVHASAAQAPESAPAVGEGDSLGSVSAEQIKRTGSESSTRPAEPVQGPA